MTLKEKAINWIVEGIIKTFQTGKINIRTKLVITYLTGRINNMDEPKKWWQSKTIIFNILSGVVGIATSMQADKGIPPHAAEIFGTVVMIGNIILRLITTQSIGGTK